MRSHRQLAQVLALVALALAVACRTTPPATPKLTNSIRLGMTKRELLDVLGKPAIARVGVEQTLGEPADVWGYPDDSHRAKKASDVARRVLRYGVGSIDRRYTYFYFVDDRLTHWGPESASPVK